MELFEMLTKRAQNDVQRIVLPEGTEPRTLTAADRIIADGIAKIILIGDPAEIKKLADELGLKHIDQATIINPADESIIDHYAPLFYELRKKKGISMEEARLTTA
ncbi:MAG: phosphate acetyltransferase, partial [Muribaculaceae bacterium]|nr:phosphate acetyltransferase [Muribaculaceae bacterium]